LHPLRNYEIREPEARYQVPLAILCRDGRVEVKEEELPESETQMLNLVEEITRAVAALGGEGRKRA
jgi:hypothetical protein